MSVEADLALVHLELGSREGEVLARADAAASMLMMDDVDAVVRWDAVRAKVLARTGHLDEAERLARRAVERGWSTDYEDLRSVPQEALAEVLRAQGRTDEAAEALRTALAVCEAKGSVAEAAIVRRKLEDLEATAPRAGRPQR